jgi:septal ring factor EnvC (AmiA/AmiB activator)
MQTGSSTASLLPPQVGSATPATTEIEASFAKVALALTEQSKALVGLRNHVTKLEAISASNFGLIAKGIEAMNARLAKLEAEVAETRPQIEAMKAHTESFPHALRAARRSDATVQNQVRSFEARLRQVEMHLGEGQHSEGNRDPEQ